MAEGDIAPQQHEQDVIYAKVSIDGSPIDDAAFYFYTIEVEHGINEISKARIVLLDGNPSTQSFDQSSSDKFSPGGKIKIEVGYREPSSGQVIFEGFIISSGIKAGEGEHSRLFVECVGNAYRLTIGRRTKYFEQMDDSDVITQIVSSYNSVSLGSVESSALKHKCLVQYNSTDWDFILMRAEACGMIIYTQENQFTVRKPQMNGSPSLKVEFGSDIVKIDIQADARYQVKKVATSSWDSSSLSLVSAQSNESALELNSQGDSKVSGEVMADFVHPFEYKLHSSGPKTEAELTKWANGQLLKSRFSRIRGVVSFQGNSSLKCDSLIELGGLGDYFNGNAYVTRVVHKVEEGNWITQAHIGYSSIPFVESKSNVNIPEAAGLLPGIDGLYNAIVTKIDADPDGEFRIQVKIPVLSDTSTIWARMTSIYASKDIGVFFLPEVGDEVIVGFIQNDPQHPVILGKVHSKKMPAPFKPDAQNTIKGIVTQNKLKLVFEDQKKNILIETPGGQKIWIKDEDKTITLQDSHRNKIVMDSSGITIDSAKDINIKATGKINVNANQNIAVESKAGDVTSTGLNVKTDAKIMASVKGNMAELKGTATTEIKGGLVRIN